MRLLPSPETLAQAAANAFDMTFRGGVGDLRRQPASIIDEGPQRTVYRYLPTKRRESRGVPVLLVPPLAAPATCFDLRPGVSVAEHLLAQGHDTYLVDYGDIAFSDRELGLEHWVEDVIPQAARAAAEDAGSPVVLYGWCLGGIMSLLAQAHDRELPIAGVAMVASPFDFHRVRMVAPLRPVDRLTRGQIVSTLYRILGGAPAPLVKRGYQFAALDKQITKPYTLLTHLHDRDFLSQIEAVDDFMSRMHAYPGRTFGQLYHRFFRVNELAAGELELPDGEVKLADVDVPVLSVAGAGDGIAPRGAVFAVKELLTGAPSVRLETAPGGHLGVLTGRGARRSTWRHVDAFLTDVAVEEVAENVIAEAA